jgi:3'-phosphoadenosine 5'-phosphosulfate sulfotransferase (PAPS reductase)/FAD synthetase
LKWTLKEVEYYLEKNVPQKYFTQAGFVSIGCSHVPEQF